MQSLIITNSGEELISKLIAGTATARFTRLSASDHDYSGTALETLTELLDVRQSVPLSSVVRIDTAMIKLTAAMDNSKLEAGYYVRALGLFAEDNGGNEILFAVSVEPEHPSYLPPFSGKTVSSIDYAFNVKVNNSKQITIEIAPGAPANADMIYNSVEISSNPIPSPGVRTHFYIVKTLSAYNPRYPVSGVEEGYLETDSGMVKGFLQDGDGIHRMALLVE